MTIAAPTLFAFRHDWGQPFKVTRAWATDVLTASDGSEVRAQLRANPNVNVTMHAVFLTEHGAGRLLAQWRGATQPLRYYVPLWCDASDLTSAVTPGDSTINCDTTDRPFFEDAGYAMLFREITPGLVTSELVTIDTVSGSSFTISGTTANSYAIGGTRVVPCRIMWLQMPVTVAWLSARIAIADLSFLDQRAQAGLGLDGTDTTATPASLVVYVYDMNRTGTFTTGGGQHPYYCNLEAMPADALGVPLPSASVAWSATVGITVTPAINSRFARVYVTSSGRVTATAGTASGTMDT